jgi:hypothetical protein
MKTGKTLKLIGFNKAKVSYGTVDFKNFKSTYLNLQTWATPKIDLENWSSVVGSLSRNIKHIVYDVINPQIFETNFIVDLDLRTSGIVFGKKSFANLEITFYVKPTIEFKSTILKEEFKLISKIIYEKIINDNRYFEFQCTKKLPEIELIENQYIYR